MKNLCRAFLASVLTTGWIFMIFESVHSSPVVEYPNLSLSSSSYVHPHSTNGSIPIDYTYADSDSYFDPDYESFESKAKINLNILVTALVILPAIGGLMFCCCIYIKCYGDYDYEYDSKYTKSSYTRIV